MHTLDICSLPEKRIHPLGKGFSAVSRSGHSLAVNNYYLTYDGQPILPVSGELHFSRLPESRWEDEIIKMKLGGVTIVSTYVFWNHHEETEGTFRFDGCRDLRRFVSLCAKHGLYVILRIGPFNHGEARNGGMPDWLYGKPYEVRSLQKGFMEATERLYRAIAGQVDGMFFADDGPVIGVQLDNEYMHSAAPWEMTTGVSNEWLTSGTDGDAYLLALKDLAAQCGFNPVFYTCTSWGGASTPAELLPLWGGYAFRPWLFYHDRGEHPATEEYVYQDYHKNGVTCTDDFQPFYPPEDKPYACCEMGGGMMCSYYYRAPFSCESVDALANIKLGSGCNMPGYYMYHGGTNPTTLGGQYLNEGQVPKISYDYQAPLGEFGQARLSYRRLRIMHSFLRHFGGRLCPMQAVLPAGASHIAPTDGETLRYAVRTDGHRGFLFVNNYQDHFDLPDRMDEAIRLTTDAGEIDFNFGIASGENAILPFRFDMDGVELVSATAQPVAKAGNTWVFLVPDGMRGSFTFAEGASVNGTSAHVYTCSDELTYERFTAAQGVSSVRVLVVSRAMANRMAQLQDGSLIFTDGVVLEDAQGVRIESDSPVCTVTRYAESDSDFLHETTLTASVRTSQPAFRQTAPGRYVIDLPDDMMDGVKDAVLELSYQGDIGQAFLGGRMISDNFCGGTVWEIGWQDFAQAAQNESLVVYISPLKAGARVSVESSMAARSETVDSVTQSLDRVSIRRVYEFHLT